MLQVTVITPPPPPPPLKLVLICFSYFFIFGPLFFWEDDFLTRKLQSPDDSEVAFVDQVFGKTFKSFGDRRGFPQTVVSHESCKCIFQLVEKIHLYICIIYTLRFIKLYFIIVYVLFNVWRIYLKKYFKKNVYFWQSFERSKLHES